MKHYHGRSQRIDVFREEYEFLSNFYPARVFFDGVLYASNEAAYQAQKCARHEDRLAFAQLPADEAKRLGRKAELREDWEDVKVELMRGIVCAKFAQHPYLTERLMRTGELPLEEGNYWHDVFWGVDSKTGRGRNELGKILMALRADIREKGIEDQSALIPQVSFGPVRGMTARLDDLSATDCDVVVNAADHDLIGGNGVPGAILGAAGDALYEACAAAGKLNCGELFVTDGYRMQAKHIIHVVGPNERKHGVGMLADCYKRALDLAASLGAGRVALPLFTSAAFGFSRETAVRIAVTAVHGWLCGHEDAGVQAEFITLDSSCYALLRGELENVCAMRDE